MHMLVDIFRCNYHYQLFKINEWKEYLLKAFILNGKYFFTISLIGRNLIFKVLTNFNEAI